MKSSHIFVVCSALLVICASSPVPENVATTTVATAATATTTATNTSKPADSVPSVPGVAAINPNTATSKEEIPEPKALPQTSKTVPAQLAEKIEAPVTAAAPSTEQSKQVSGPFRIPTT